MYGSRIRIIYGSKIAILILFISSVISVIISSVIIFLSFPFRYVESSFLYIQSVFDLFSIRSVSSATVNLRNVTFFFSYDGF